MRFGDETGSLSPAGRWRWLLVASVALLLAACGGSGGSGGDADAGACASGACDDTRGAVQDSGRETHGADAPDTHAASEIIDTDADTDAGRPPSVDLALLMDEVMAPAIDPSARELDRCVGAVAVVVTAEGTVARGYGATELDGAVVPDGRTLFSVGSLTKVFTGLGLARLEVDDGVAPTTLATELLADDIAAALRPGPSLLALATHRTGLPQFPGNLVDRDGDGVRDPGIDVRSPAAGYGREHLAAFLQTQTVVTDAPYGYSNVGIGLLGLALQDYSGLDGHDATLRHYVTDALNMQDTWGEVAAIPPAALERLAAGHAVADGARVDGIPGSMGVLASAGEIVTTGDDMARFLAALSAAEPSSLESAIATALTPQSPGPDGRQMGYAVEIEERDGRTVYRKGGNTSSYAAYLLFAREPSVGVAVLTSCGGFRRVVALSEALFDAALTRELRE